MANSIDICNSALIKLGAGRITSLTEDKKEARICNEQYDKLRQDLLRSHPWNFAIKRAELAKTATPVTFEYTNQFALPTDCLKVLYLHDRCIEFQIEGRFLVTGASTVKIKYVSDVTNVADFDVKFREALAWYIAADIAYNLIQSNTLAAQIIQKADMEIARARSLDAQEGTPPGLTNDQFITSRY